MQYLIIIIVLYIYIFNPVFRILGLGLNNILLLMSIFYAILKFRDFRKYITAYRAELLILIISSIYLMIRITTSNDDDTSPFLLLQMFLSLLFIPIFLVNVVLSKVKDKGFFNIIIAVGLVGAIISIMCLVSPSFNQFIRDVQIEKEMVSVENLGLSRVRSFGLGGNLTSAYGYMMGLLASICMLKLTDEKKLKYLFYSFLFVIAAIINARIGIFPFLFVILLIAIKNVRNFDFKFMIVIIVIGLFSSISLILLKEKNPEMYDYLNLFFEFFSSSENYENSAYDNMLHFPETVDGLIFGEGRDVFSSDAYERSDIGFVRDIYLGGLIFLSLLIIQQFFEYKKMHRRSCNLIFMLILLSSNFVFYYKGCPFYTATAITRFIMLYYFLLVYNEIHKSKRISI